MKFKVLGLSLVALATFAISSRSVAHPAYSAPTNRTVIANFPINPQAPVMTGPMVIANYPINGVGAYPVAPPSYATYAPAHYSAAQVPVRVPVQVPVPVQMPVQVPVQHTYVQQASTQVIPAPVTYQVVQPAPVPVPVVKQQAEVRVVHQPAAAAVSHVSQSAHLSQSAHVAAPQTTLRPMRPVDCICARSATGAKVNVYNTAARWQAAPATQIGGGKTTVDVRGFHQGYWRVSYRNKSGGVKYGWVREQDLVCKQTRVTAPGY